jgi:predicted membrane-bound spermidine synthase
MNAQAGTNSHLEAIEGGDRSDVPTLQRLDAPPSRIFLGMVVAYTGACVMVLELLGTRIIGPYFGVSLYVWSSLIAVTMIALAIGYFVGGWCADRCPRVRLGHVLILAGAGALAIPVISGPVLMATEPLGMKLGTLLSATVLFLLPLTCLGTAGPFVIRLAARDLASVGTTAGSVYAVSTVGSVLGTLGLGFFLLPALGTRAIVLGTGISLVALGIGLALYERRAFSRRHLAILLAAAVATAAGLLASTPSMRAHAAGFTIIDEAESSYGWVRVVDDHRHGVRLLLSDASSIGAVDLRTGNAVLDYQQLLMLLPQIGALADLPRNGDAARCHALRIGLGAGLVATELERQGIPTDTIEIDPDVARAAQVHFGFRPTGKFIVGDGRYEIRNLARRYDLIIHDCFTGGAEPSHLLPREMFERLKALMKHEGILALNYVGFSRGDGAEALASVARTLQEVFPFQRVFATRPNEEFSDFVFLVSAHPIRIAAREGEVGRRLGILANLEVEPPRAGGIVLTDDFNPIEHMQSRKAEVYRQLFVERVARELLIR